MTIGWLILFCPLFAAVLITLFTRKEKEISAVLSVGAILLSCLFTVKMFLASHGDILEMSRSWLSVGDLQVDFGLQFDSLSLLMLLVVTGVGSAIHIYSIGYMWDDPGFTRFFACLSFFTFSMLGIVLSTNFFQMFIFWELVGVSSYLLIGFWFEKASAADAAKKAFLTNRVGDFGFLLGIIMVWAATGTLKFAGVHGDLISHPAILGGAGTIIGLLIFCGAVGKSAQFPLHVWLPDAMEGPTPVSALIHAATMVAAGVYMLCRVVFLFDPASLMVIAWIGGITALLAALIAVQQNDIKRILAYSTLSQLGYMVMAVGLGGQGSTAAMYHLTTHAFFKALLFLGAGSVIHAMHHEQDIWKMGALTKKLPVTWWTFLIGTLALCGVPPLSGFYSKDLILGTAYEQHNYALFIVGVFVAVLTTFYMFRLVFVAFLGRAKSEASGHAHESPKVMIYPLIVLAFASLFGGLFGIKEFVGQHFAPSAGKTAEAGGLAGLFAPFAESPVAALSGLFAVMVGFSLAWSIYADAQSDPLPAKLGAFARLMRNKFYFDELYEAIIGMTQEATSIVADFFDRWIIAGLFVRGAHGTTELVGRGLRLMQSGNLQTYALFSAVGIALFLFFALF